MYFSLLKTWCDKLIDLQVKDPSDAAFYGGILCPSCARIHGRCADAIYPMMYLAEKTGQPNYLNSAKALFQWAEYNMTRPDGSYINDTNSTWAGITVFANIQLGEALHYHGHLLDKHTLALWEQRYRLSSDFMHDHIDSMVTNINYPIACSAAMALAGRYFSEEHYHTKAKALAHKAIARITPEGFMDGEGRQPDVVTKTTHAAVDLGYNVEESLPSLVTYALLEGDEEVLALVIRSLHTHLEFMLPDGGWDNSWGSRSNKWTYWGSRTSDGMHGAYGLLAAEEPLFAEAVYRNTKLLQACTHQGLLHGGPMYYSAGEPPCVHHTFCHAKALATLLNFGAAPVNGALLPRETAPPVQEFLSIATLLLRQTDWNATITNYPYDYVVEGHATGGALTMLYHKKIGPLCVGTMTEYQVVEANNMQLPQRVKDICHTPRIEQTVNGIYYRSINDKSATVTVTEQEGSTTVRVQGILRSGTQEGTHSFEITYTLEPDSISIAVTTSAADACFVYPIISNHAEAYVQETIHSAKIYRRGSVVELSTTGELTVKTSPEVKANPLAQRFSAKSSQRVFNPVGGFQAIPFLLPLRAGQETVLVTKVL